MIPLFRHYPSLKDKLHHVSLGEFPTPIARLDQLGDELGLHQLYIKNDGLSGEIYGGNKVRKLEFLLAEALHGGAKEVLTFGCAGSNHALATTIYAQQVGLGSVLMLMPQPNAHYVRRNLLMAHRWGAELHQHRNFPVLTMATLAQGLRHRRKHRHAPHLIPVGGSSPVGVAGFVNAAFELRDQIAGGDMPEPDYIYVALGSMGTAVGLALGIRAAGLNCSVVPVRVIGERFATERKMVRLFKKTNSFLHSLDPDFTKYDYAEQDTGIRHEFYGGEYARFTEEGGSAVARMERSEGIRLEGTYTGKAFAALLADAEDGGLQDKGVLFWNTHNARDFSQVISGIDYHELPKVFHRYFEQEVQPLDQ
jgi:D-cysteine desulfhydrase